MAEVADRAHPSSGSAIATASAESSAAIAGPPVRKNRSVTKKRKAKRKREKAQSGTSSGTAASQAITPRERAGHTDNTCRKGSVDTPPSAGKPTKKRRG